MAWCLTAVVISAGSSCGSREERPGSTRSNCTAGTEPPKYDCTTCISIVVVRKGEEEEEEEGRCNLYLQKQEMKNEEETAEGGREETERRTA